MQACYEVAIQDVPSIIEARKMEMESILPGFYTDLELDTTSGQHIKNRIYSGQRNDERR